MNLSEKITALRNQQNWSQEELAGHLNVPHRSVSDWEAGRSVPELEHIVRLCALFGVTADALIRDDLGLDGSDAPADGHPVLSLQEAYAYVAEYQTVARKIALGTFACVASPAPLIAVSNFSGNDLLCMLIGLPALFLMIAWGVWMFINVGTITARFRRIDRRRFTPGPGVTRWAREAREKFRPSWVRDVATGVAICIFSPAAIMLFAALDWLFIGWGDTGAAFGTGVMLALIGLGVYMIVRSCVIRNCYQRLLKAKDV